MDDYYKDIDKLSYDELAAHCRKHQLDSDISDEMAEKVFRMAWESGHAYGNHEVAVMYVDQAELANAIHRHVSERYGFGKTQ